MATLRRVWAAAAACTAVAMRSSSREGRGSVEAQDGDERVRRKEAECFRQARLLRPGAKDVQSRYYHPGYWMLFHQGCMQGMSEEATGAYWKGLSEEQREHVSTNVQSAWMEEAVRLGRFVQRAYMAAGGDPKACQVPLQEVAKDHTSVPVMEALVVVLAKRNACPGAALRMFWEDLNRPLLSRFSTEVYRDIGRDLREASEEDLAAWYSHKVTVRLMDAARSVVADACRRARVEEAHRAKCKGIVKRMGAEVRKRIAQNWPSPCFEPETTMSPADSKISPQLYDPVYRHFASEACRRQGRDEVWSAQVWRSMSEKERHQWSLSRLSFVADFAQIYAESMRLQGSRSKDPVTVCKNALWDVSTTQIDLREVLISTLLQRQVCLTPALAEFWRGMSGAGGKGESSKKAQQVALGLADWIRRAGSDELAEWSGAELLMHDAMALSATLRVTSLQDDLSADGQRKCAEVARKIIRVAEKKRGSGWASREDIEDALAKHLAPSAA